MLFPLGKGRLCSTLSIVHTLPVLQSIGVHVHSPPNLHITMRDFAGTVALALALWAQTLP